MEEIVKSIRPIRPGRCRYVRIRLNYVKLTASITKRGRGILDQLIDDNPDAAIKCIEAIQDEVAGFHQRAKAAQRAMKEKADG